MMSFFYFQPRSELEVLKLQAAFSKQTASNACLYNFKHVNEGRKWVKVSCQLYHYHLLSCYVRTCISTNLFALYYRIFYSVPQTTRSQNSANQNSCKS